MIVKIDPVKLAMVTAEAKVRHRYREEIVELENKHLEEFRAEKVAAAERSKLEINEHKAAHAAEIQAIKDAAIQQPVLSAKRHRNNSRKDVLKIAVRLAEVKDSASSVYEAIKLMAASTRYRPLLGYDKSANALIWEPSSGDGPPEVQSAASAKAAIRRLLKELH